MVPLAALVAASAIRPATSADTVLRTPNVVVVSPALVRGQGLEFVHIPIDFVRPAEADVRLFFDTMRRLHDRKVLVHCQVNMRAAAMTFLYRTIVDGEEPERAYEAVAAVWSPQGQWKALSVAHLRQAGIAFVPY